MSGRLASLWAVLGVTALFLFAVIRLGGRGLRTVSTGLGPLEWTALVVLTVAFVWGEGRGALQLRWVPRLLRRADDLRSGAPLRHCLMAPLYGMGLVGASPARVLRAWAGTVVIIGAVLVVRSFPEPWRGIVDLSVAAALSWGLGALALQSSRTLRDDRASARASGPTLRS